MSGHSKWSTIKNKKGKLDAKRGNIFTKIGREIAVAVKQGGADPNMNPRLRDAIQKAKENNMPNDNINRSIKKASGDMDGVNYEEIIYEGYGSGGIAVIVKTLTDNKNRTAGDVRHAFDKYNGSLGASGCVSYMFKRRGVIITDKSMDEEELMLQALEAGAEDIIEKDDLVEIYTEPTNYKEVLDALKAQGIEIINSEITMVADNEIEPEDKYISSFTKMIDMLEDNDDVQEVFHNAILKDMEDSDGY